jgi:hypothetical protein
MSVVPPASSDPRPGALRTIWPNLPVLLVGSVPVALAWAALRVLPPGWGWLSLVGIGLVVLPALAALVRGCELLLAGDEFGLADLLPTLRGSCPRAVRVTAVPTAAALLTSVALGVWRQTHQTWVLASVGTGIAATAATGLVAVVALPYSLRAAGPWQQTWLVSGYIATRNLVPVLGVVSALVLGVWAAAHLSFALVLLLPGPVAMIWAAALVGATRASRVRLAARTGPRP